MGKVYRAPKKQLPETSSIAEWKEAQCWWWQRPLGLRWPIEGHLKCLEPRLLACTVHLLDRALNIDFASLKTDLKTWRPLSLCHVKLTWFWSILLATPVWFFCLNWGKHCPIRSVKGWICTTQLYVKYAPIFNHLHISAMIALCFLTKVQLAYILCVRRQSWKTRSFAGLLHFL